MDHFVAWKFGRRDHRVVGEVRGDGVAVVVVAHLFEQGLRRALGDASMNLTVEQQWVEHASGIVASNVTNEANLTCFGVDFDHGNVSAERIRGACGRERGALLEAAFGLHRDGKVGPSLGDSGRTDDVE